MFPPADLSSALLGDLRQQLQQLGFDEATICERSGCPTLYDFRTLRTGRTAGVDLTDAVDVLIRLFLDGETVPHGTVAELLPASLMQALTRAGLLTVRGASVAAAALLYPTDGLYIVSDLEIDPDFPSGRPDSVYPAITKSCEVYRSTLPRQATPAFLELCSGTGIAALLAARPGGHAWAVDITQRSTDFARFNAALNGLDNVTALRGDLFEPVADLDFDCIVAHPPYVPSLEQRQIYRDGGEDGEQITRRILAETHRHLRPGGRLCCTCVGTDREDAPFERRIRSMLGPHADDCDVLLLENHGEGAGEYLSMQVTKNVLSLPEAERFRVLFNELQIQQFLGCTIVIERHAKPRSPLTLRRQRGGVEPVDVNAVLRWEAFPRDPDALRSLTSLRPRLSRRARMETTHTPLDSVWVLKRVRIEVDAPLTFAMDTSPQAATFLAWCDGSRTVAEHRDRLVAEGAVEPDTPVEGLAEMVRSLLAVGLLETDPGDEHPVSAVRPPAALQPISTMG